MSGSLPHAVRLLQRVGVSDIPAAFVILVVALLQYVFLWRLWDGYIFSRVGDVIAARVGYGLFGFGLATAAIVVVFLTTRRIRSARATAKLEKEARNRSFDRIRSLLTILLPRTLLRTTPALLYTPRSSFALESRQGWNGANPAVVVGLSQRERAEQTSEAFSAQLGHEISHLELGATGIEVIVRRAVAIHFMALGCLVVTFIVALGFVDVRGIRDSGPLSALVPVLDKTLYLGLLSQWLVILLTALIVYIYPYFYVVRREHAHDIRGSQLAGTNALADQVFDTLAAAETSRTAVRQFFQLHPSARARKRVVLRHDVLLVSAIVYPLIVGGIQPLCLLLVAGWRDVLGIDRDHWNLALTGFSGLLLFLAITSDLSRVGVGLLLDRRRVIWLVGYALITAVATQIPRLLLEISFGIRKGFTFEEIATRFVTGFAVGALNIVVLLAALLLIAGYTRAVMAAAFGFEQHRWLRLVQDILLAILVVLAFAASSLTSTALQLQTIALALLVFVVATLPTAFAKCPICARRAQRSFLLSSTCTCGHDRLAALRKITATSYVDQVRQASPQ